MSGIGNVLGGLVTSIFGGGGKISQPEVKAPAVMPTPDDQAVQAAKRRQIAAIQNRSGRVSTILSTDDKLGG